MSSPALNETVGPYVLDGAAAVAFTQPPRAASRSAAKLRSSSSQTGPGHPSRLDIRIRSVDDLAVMFASLTELTEIQRKSLMERYGFLLREYRRRCRFFSFWFYFLRLTMTVGSLTVPAILSIQTTNQMSSATYWFTWALSLAVTTANGIMTLFKVDKRFFTLHATMERLRSETWQYLQLSGRYSGLLGTEGETATHANQYVYYCSQLERIHMMRVDDEYIRNSELESADNPHADRRNVSGAASTMASNVAVPTPANPNRNGDSSRAVSRRNSENF